MAAIDWTLVVAFAPALSTTAAAAQTAILAWANAAVDPAAFDGESGPTTQMARVNLAAHAGTMSKQGGGNGAGGPLVRRQAGGVFEEWAQPGGGVAYDALNSTPYGRAFRQLAASSKYRGPFVLNGC